MAGSALKCLQHCVTCNGPNPVEGQAILCSPLRHPSSVEVREARWLQRSIVGWGGPGPHLLPALAVGGKLPGPVTAIRLWEKSNKISQLTSKRVLALQLKFTALKSTFFLKKQ